MANRALTDGIRWRVSAPAVGLPTATWIQESQRPVGTGPEVRRITGSEQAVSPSRECGGGM